MPTRDGVGASCIALPPGPWPRVIDFLAERFETLSRSEIEARMLRGEVRDAAGELILPAHSYRPHAKLYYYRHIESEARIPFDEVVLFEDDYLVAVDKPHFLPVTPGGRYLQETLLVRLKRRLALDSLAPMHRIDRETAGLVLFTKQPHTRGLYQALFSQREVTKRYQAVAPYRGDLPLPMTYRSRLVGADHFMRMHETAGAPNAETRLELMETFGGLARYRLLPVTGKRHQLRVQMAALGIPIINDQIYPDHLSKAQIEADDFSRPLQLLADYISLRDPVTGEQRRFESRMRLHAF
jgi:tRNA pseudouridine32 synthase/23S rRNA pseudouridine746 synthase